MAYPQAYPPRDTSGGTGAPSPYPPRDTSGAMPVPFAPKSDVMAIPQPFVPSAHDQWKDKNKQSNPAVTNGSVVAAGDPSASVTRMGGGNQNVDLSRDNSWMAFMGQEAENNSPGAVNTPATNPNWPWGPEQASTQSGATGPRTTGSRPGGGGGTQQQYASPITAMKYPDMPKYEGVGEYKPPEEDQGVYDKARREAMGPGMRELREGTREAISSAQSLDNPNARAKFVQQALKGYGQGLEGVASSAGKEARGVARDKRQEQLSMYKTNYEIKSNNYLMNYQAEINTIAQDFASGQAAQMYNAQPGVGGPALAPNKTSQSKSMQKYGFEVIY